jgi:hypothetical protein
MHTSTRLTAKDFQHWKPAEGQRVQIDFHTFCPDYHERDRLAVVCPHLEDGVLHTAYALLALTTAFYDVLRGRGCEFFDYPSHFAFIAANSEGVSTHNGHQPMERDAIGGSWGNLDVWPETQWITTPGTATEMLEKIFSFQINRLFWPEGFKPEAGEIPLHKNARRFLKARLKAVYYYDTTVPNVEIHATQQVEDLVQASIDQLPPSAVLERPPARADGLPYVEAHRQVEVDEFLEAVASSFEQ